jgi:hypothetical protein
MQVPISGLREISTETAWWMLPSSISSRTICRSCSGRATGRSTTGTEEPGFAIADNGNGSVSIFLHRGLNKVLKSEAKE